MPEVVAALIGAMVAALLMVLANRSNRDNGNFRELFHRMNAVEKELARLEVGRNRNWRKQ